MDDTIRALIKQTLKDPFPSDDLTKRERAVLRLAARAMTNDEIAAKLQMSATHVNRVLCSALPKIGVNSKHKLTEYMLRQIEHVIR